MIHPDTHPNFAAMYPLSSALGLKVINAGPGFDSLDIQKALGEKRFESLMSGLKDVFCCQHASYPEGHEFAGYEVHCIYARDLEAFLKGGK